MLLLPVMRAFEAHRVAIEEAKEPVD